MEKCNSLNHKCRINHVWKIYMTIIIIIAEKGPDEKMFCEPIWGGYGEEIFCDPGFVIQGLCGSGGDQDCDERSHMMTCCDGK